MERSYKKLLAEHKITVADLPADAQTGIKKIKAIDVAINMATKKAEKAGKTYTPSASVLSDIKAFDKWVVMEILDYIEDKDTNTDKPAVEAAEIIADIKADEPIKVDEPIVAKAEEIAIEKADPKGVAIDAEFTELLKSNKSELTLEDLKIFSPEAYNVVFANYDKGGVNGINTTYHSLVEVNDKFVLTKK